MATFVLNNEEQKKQKASEAAIDLYNCFKGDWGKGKSTEEYCNDLRRDLIPAKKIEL